MISLFSSHAFIRNELNSTSPCINSPIVFSALYCNVEQSLKFSVSSYSLPKFYIPF